MNYSTIVGTGSFLPERVIRNTDFPAELNTSDEWIRTRTGIHSRHIAEPDASSAEFSKIAAQRALEAANMSAEDIELIIVATTTPDQVFPSTACVLQDLLKNEKAVAFDLQGSACSGFVYALAVADQFIRTGQYKNALVVGVDIFSRLLDWTDRSTCVLFGDGAGAVVIKASDKPGILGEELRSNGAMRNALSTAGYISGGKVVGTPFLTMDGGAVYKFAVKALTEVSNSLLARLKLPVESVDWLIPHQANIRIIEATAKRLHIPMEKVIVTVGEHGNTSAASIPLAMDVGIRSGKIKHGQRVLMAGIGGGFIWGAIVLDY